MGAPGLWDAYLIWRRIAGPFADFVLPTPFLAEWEADPRSPRHPQARRLAHVIAGRVGPGTAVYLETPLRLGLATGTRLTEAGWAFVPMIGRWPAPLAVLPTRPLVNWLAAPPTRIDVPVPSAGAGWKRICFLLDGERECTVSSASRRTHFDNRYGYGAFALPPAAHLRRQEISKVWWICPSAAPAPDLHEYAEGLVDAGISIEFTPLTSLSSPVPLTEPRDVNVNG